MITLIITVLAIVGLIAYLKRPKKYTFQPYTGTLRAKFGINDFWHPDGGVPVEILEHYAAWGGDVTIRVPLENRQAAQVWFDAVAAFPTIQTIVLIEKPDSTLVDQIAPLAVKYNARAVELGNELDLAGLTSDEFATFVALGVDILTRAGFKGDIISGGVYTVSEQTISWATPMLTRCPSVVFGVHWYQSTDDNTCGMLQALRRRIAVTEFGLPVLGTEQDKQAEYTQRAMERFNLVPVEYMIYYERMRGPITSTDNLDRFGIYEPETKTWFKTDNVLANVVKNGLTR